MLQKSRLLKLKHQFKGVYFHGKSPKKFKPDEKASATYSSDPNIGLNYAQKKGGSGVLDKVPHNGSAT